jgi:hypothetical protein
MKRTKSERITANKKIIFGGIALLVILTLSLLTKVYLFPSAPIRQLGITEKGIVTKKYKGCGKETLQSDGSYVKSGGLCDGGNSITLNDKSISTGGGALTAKKERIANIENIHPGDVVEVQYIPENGAYSTNCETCYIKLLNQQSISAGFAD